jgi:hypothetical protein
MSSVLQPLHLLLMMVAGWVNRHQLDAIDYLQEEHRVLKERLGGRRIRFTDAERRRLARKAYVPGRKALNGLGTLVTPDTLLRWPAVLHRHRIPVGARRRHHTSPRQPMDESGRAQPHRCRKRFPSKNDSCDPPLSSRHLSPCIGASVSAECSTITTAQLPERRRSSFWTLRVQEFRHLVSPVRSLFAPSCR